MNQTGEVSAAWMEAMFGKVSNWGRWGKDDERGTLNYLRPADTVAAAALVRTGRTVSLSRNFPTQPGPQNPWPAQHHMVIAGDDPCIPAAGGLEASTDYIGIAYHGLASTHLDALCHVFQGGLMYNGYPATDVKSTGARRNTVMTLKEGLAGRGVLLDAPRALGAPFVEPARPLGIAELERIEAAQGLRVREGDMVLVRVGREPRAQLLGDGRLAGLHPEAMSWLHERKVAVLGADGVHDPIPPGSTPGWPMPVHMIALVAMGLHLLDNLELESLAQMCASEDRWEFLLTLAPLRIEGGTGSPLNPIALF